MSDAQQPWELLGLAQGASSEEIRAAYLRLVKSHPPESSPEMFERIRDAYEQMRDPRARMKQMMEADPLEPLGRLLDQMPPERRFAGPKLWLAVLKEGGTKR